MCILTSRGRGNMKRGFLLGVGGRGGSGGSGGSVCSSSCSSADDDGATAKRQRACMQCADAFKCSITGQLMVDPVSIADGQIHERAAITRWLSKHETSPNTGVKLSHKHVLALPAVRAAIQALIDSETLPEEEMGDWLLRKGVSCAAAREFAAAKTWLQRAHGIGVAAAGFQLGRTWMAEAACAGVEEAVEMLEATRTPPEVLTSLDDVRVGDIVRLSTDAMQKYIRSHREGILYPESLINGGETCFVRKIDHEDDTLGVRLDDGSELWLPIVCCVKLRSFEAKPLSLPRARELLETEESLVNIRPDCRAAVESAGIKFTLPADYDYDRLCHVTDIAESADSARVKLCNCSDDGQHWLPLTACRAVDMDEATLRAFVAQALKLAPFLSK